jgi:hypothetical protein
MKWSDAHKNYQDYSGLVSTTVRQAAYAGIALIWVVRPHDGEGIPRRLALAGIALFFCLAFDIVGYIAGTYIWKFFADVKEQQIQSEKLKYEEYDFVAPRSINMPYDICLALKCLSLLWAYSLVITYLVQYVLSAP